MALTDDAIDKIKAMIVSGELRPGDRLPREAALAERLGLSRNSLREAVRALALIRVLDVRQGDGTFVTSLEPSLLLDALSFVVDFHRDDTVLQFLEVRRILDEIETAAVMIVLAAYVVISQQNGITESGFRVIGVEGRQFPQALLPPESAHHQAE